MWPNQHPPPHPSQRPQRTHRSCPAACVSCGARAERSRVWAGPGRLRQIPTSQTSPDSKPHEATTHSLTHPLNNPERPVRNSGKRKQKELWVKKKKTWHYGCPPFSKRKERMCMDFVWVLCARVVVLLLSVCLTSCSVQDEFPKGPKQAIYLRKIKKAVLAMSRKKTLRMEQWAVSEVITGLLTCGFNHTPY